MIKKYERISPAVRWALFIPIYLAASVSTSYLLRHSLVGALGGSVFAYSLMGCITAFVSCCALFIVIPKAKLTAVWILFAANLVRIGIEIDTVLAPAGTSVQEHPSLLVNPDVLLSQAIIPYVWAALGALAASLLVTIYYKKTIR